MVGATDWGAFLLQTMPAVQLSCRRQQQLVCSRLYQIITDCKTHSDEQIQTFHS